MCNFKVSGNIVDVLNKRIYPATINIEKGKIANIDEEPEMSYEQYIMPGFIDSHVHIESSMLAPSEFARLAAVHGTVATVSDPHEIANVLGMQGIRFMIENGSQVPFKFFFGAPSCVPATQFESAGATLTAEDISSLLELPGIKYLSEMMNFPGVLYDIPDVTAKLDSAKKSGKPIDGHAPGLRGSSLEKYVRAGISTDHECTTLEEALEKINLGMKILIREGSAAKNFEVLNKLIETYPEMSMLCSDDKHPDDLVKGHINELVKQSLSLGYDLFDVLQTAILNPIKHYGLDVGLLRESDDADFIIVNNLKELNILQTYVRGVLIAENSIALIDETVKEKPNKFSVSVKEPDDFLVPRTKSSFIRVIEAVNGELVTNELLVVPKVESGNITTDIENDILKITVVNRYIDCKPTVGFVKNFGLKQGAIASSVAHDSHNIVAVGTNDKDLCIAINSVIKSKGGISVCIKGKTDILPLPVAGLMSTADGYETAKKYAELNIEAKSLGSRLDSPFMTLSFMALLVIPKLKLGDKGLFDGEKFGFTELEV